MESQINPLNELVVLLFGGRWAAIAIAGAMGLFCTGIICRTYFLFHKPLIDALDRVVDVLKPVRDANNGGEAQQIFANKFDDICAAMVVSPPPTLKMYQKLYQLYQ